MCNLKELGSNWSRHLTCKLLRSLILIISIARFLGRLLYSLCAGCSYSHSVIYKSDRYWDLHVNDEQRGQWHTWGHRQVHRHTVLFQLIFVSSPRNLRCFLLRNRSVQEVSQVTLRYPSPILSCPWKPLSFLPSSPTISTNFMHFLYRLNLWMYLVATSPPLRTSLEEKD